MTMENALSLRGFLPDEEAEDLVVIPAYEPDEKLLGVRKFEGEVPARSLIGNALTRELFAVVSGEVVSDTQTGLRAFDRSFLVDLIAVPGNRYEYEMNMLMIAARSAVPLEEVTIDTVYIENNQSSHYHAVRDSLKIAKSMLRFSGSSLLSFGIDFILFSALSGFLAGGGMTLEAAVAAANIGARVVSSVCNFTLNRMFVFKHKGSLRAAATKYFALACWILLTNTLIVTTLVGRLSMDRTAAKLVTECALFLVSYLVQRFLIFGKERADRREKKAERKTKRNGISESVI